MPLRHSGYYGKLLCNDDNFIDRIRIVTSKYRGNITGSTYNKYVANTCAYKR